MSWTADPANQADSNPQSLQDSEKDHLIQPPHNHLTDKPTSLQDHRHPKRDPSNSEHHHRHTNADAGLQHYHKDSNSKPYHRHPNGEPSRLQAQTASERELLLPEGSKLGLIVPDIVADNSDDECIQFVASSDPSVVPDSLRNRRDRHDVTQHHSDATSDVTPSHDVGSHRHHRHDAGITHAVINNPSGANSYSRNRQGGGERSQDPNGKSDDVLRVDVTMPPGDANKHGDVTVPRKVTQGPSSPGAGSVARSFTSDCIRTLGEERGKGEEGEGGGSPDGDSHHLLHPDSHKAVRRLSSGDHPHWLRTAQDGSSDVHNMTLIVPGPSGPNESYLIGRASPRGDAAAMRMTRMTEVAPPNSSIVDDEDQWRMPLQLFTSKKQGTSIAQYKAKRIRSYYKAQDQLITAFEDISLKVNDDLLDTEAIKKQRKLATFFSKLTLAINVALLIAKLVASVLSGSISIISSLVDSVVDLLSGLIMWWATRAVKTRDPYTYPQGRTKLEPVAIIILSVVMALASLQLVRESVEKIVTLASDPTDLPRVDAPTFVIAGSTVVVKLALWLVCRRVRSSIVQALAMDHRNDVLSNTVAIICGYLGSREFQKEADLQGFIYVDPAGAILISLYIVINWWQTGSEQIKMLTGHTARPDFLSKLTWTAMNHDRNIRHIDTVRAFHFGNNFLVELDIVLPEDMSLRLAHDIGESLQQKLENVPEVERAFVHLDYEYSHNPNSEHKVV